MKTRNKIIILASIVIISILVILNPFYPGYFPFPWNNMNDTYCWSYFQAYHDESVDTLALNFHIRNEIAQHGWEYNVPWRGIEITSKDNFTEIMITGSWDGVYQKINGNLTQVGVILTDDIAKFEGLTDVKSGRKLCA